MEGDRQRETQTEREMKGETDRYKDRERDGGRQTYSDKDRDRQRDRESAQSVRLLTVLMVGCVISSYSCRRFKIRKVGAEQIDREGGGLTEDRIKRRRGNKEDWRRDDERSHCNPVLRLGHLHCFFATWLGFCWPSH